MPPDETPATEVAPPPVVEDPAPVVEEPAASEEPAVEEPAGLADVAAVAAATAASADRLARAKATAERARRDRQNQLNAREAERRLSDENAQLRAQQAQYDRALRESQAALERFRKAPLDALKELGTSADELVKRAVDETTPEGRIAKLERELTEERQAQANFRRQQEEASQRQAQQAAHQRAAQAFVSMVSDDKKYPTLSAWAKVRPYSVVREAIEIINEAKANTGHVYSEKEVARYMEDMYRKIHQPQTIQEAATQESRRPVTNGQSAKTSPASPRTVSNALSAQRGRMPVNIDELPEAEANERLAELLRKA